MKCLSTSDGVAGNAPVLMKVWSWRQVILRSSLASTTKLVLLALSSHMNDHGEGCYPSLDTLAQETSLTRKAVITHIATAITAGFLAKDRMNIRGRKWASNIYRATIPIEVESDNLDFEDCGDAREAHHTQKNEKNLTSRGERHTPHDGLRGVPNTLEGCTSFLHGVYDVHTNSSENSSMNSKELSPTGKKIYPDDFEQFWILWPAPRRCEKPHAYKAWRDACKKITGDALMEALKRYLLTKEVMDGFAPYPAKWLKRERWLEFIPAENTSPPAPVIYDNVGDTPENNQWRAILQSLLSTHGEAVYRSWFSQLRMAGKNGNILMLHAPTRFVAEWVQGHYGADITRAAQSVWPNITAVHIECDSGNH